jgi:hypothetical protein
LHVEDLRAQHAVDDRRRDRSMRIDRQVLLAPFDVDRWDGRGERLPNAFDERDRRDRLGVPVRG